MKLPAPFRAFAVAALVTFAATPALIAADLTLELMADLKMVEDAQLSPDGNWVTYLVSDETARDGKGRSIELWIATANGELSQRRLLPANLRATEARWSPRENLLAIAITHESAPRQRQLALVAAHGKISRVLAENFSGT